MKDFDNTEILDQNMKKIFSLQYEIKKQLEQILNYFNYLNTLVMDEDFNDLLKYNEKDDNSLLFMFLQNYNFYLENYHQIKDNFDINQIKNDIDISSQIFESQNQ